jgi:hypothetical protein
LKKILDELEKVLDQVETELQRRNEETPGRFSFLVFFSFKHQEYLWEHS